MMQDQSITNDLEWVKQEIFMREYDNKLVKIPYEKIDIFRCLFHGVWYK